MHFRTLLFILFIGLMASPAEDGFIESAPVDLEETSIVVIEDKMVFIADDPLNLALNRGVQHVSGLRSHFCYK